MIIVALKTTPLRLTTARSASANILKMLSRAKYFETIGNFFVLKESYHKQPIILAR